LRFRQRYMATTAIVGGPKEFAEGFFDGVEIAIKGAKMGRNGILPPVLHRSQISLDGQSRYQGRGRGRGRGHGQGRGSGQGRGRDLNSDWRSGQDRDGDRNIEWRRGPGRGRA
jgi:hypothetical protein